MYISNIIQIEMTHEKENRIQRTTIEEMNEEKTW
jgi:hypothetical protein